jgi:2,4-dienoyl-CoA reductase-like NADH-dependent reductase (Old Yellow Enzyme family)
LIITVRDGQSKEPEVTDLFAPLTLRAVTTRNRIAISPMCQYSAIDGVATDWHIVHLGKFAQGGAGIVMTEATAVSPQGRITHGDLGLWHDGQIAPLARVAAFLKANGAVPAVQLAHAGRKGSKQRPWFGGGALGEEDFARGDMPWELAAPSAVPLDEASIVPHAMTVEEIEALVAAFEAAARRSVAAGFDILELHFAHGYLLHEFLSPLSNLRDDLYGGDRAGRMKLPLDIVARVRAAWPQERPLFVRVSAVDGIDGGVTIDDTIAFAIEAKARGADLIDCSSGGILGPATAARIPRGYGFQLPYAQAVREKAGIATMAVGLIVHPEHAQAAIADGVADLVAVGREALFDPNWALHAQLVLAPSDPPFVNWPDQYGWWLDKREPGLLNLDGPPLPFRRGAA